MEDRQLQSRLLCLPTHVLDIICATRHQKMMVLSMGNSTSAPKYSIAELAAAHDWARKQATSGKLGGDYSAAAIHGLNGDLFVEMMQANGKTHDFGLQLVQNLIHEHPDAGKLPPLTHTPMLNNLDKAEAWALATAPRPILDLTNKDLERRIQIAGLNSQNSGLGFIRSLRRAQILQNYTTHPGVKSEQHIDGPITMTANDYHDQMANVMKKRSNARQLVANAQTKLEIQSLVDRRARYDGRVLTAMQNSAVAALLKEVR